MLPRRGLFDAQRVALAVPALGGAEIADIDADARGLVRQLALLIKRVRRLGLLARPPVRDYHRLVFAGVRAIAGEGVRHRHRALGIGLGRRIRRRIDERLEDRARLRRLSIEIEADRFAHLWRETATLLPLRDDGRRRSE